MKKFQVLTGIRRFEQEAASPNEAISALKAKIDARRNMRKNPEIGMSLVEALDEGRLNFLVLDEAGLPVAGENSGVYQDPPEANLIRQFQKMLRPK